MHRAGHRTHDLGHTQDVSSLPGGDGWWESWWVGGSHCFWNFCQAPQTLHPGPLPGSLSLTTYPHTLPCHSPPYPVNGKVHSALQPKLGGLPRCLLSLHSAPPSAISLSPSPSLYLPTCLSLAHLSRHLNCHLTGLEPFSLPTPQGSYPTLPLFSPSYSVFLQPGDPALYCKSDHITPFLKNPSRFPMALRIKSTLAKLLTALRIQPHLQLKFQTNQISSTSSQLALWLAVRAFEHAVPSPWKVSIPFHP